MKRVTGIGGIFFKVDDMPQLAAWYREHLNIDMIGDSYTSFEWRDKDQPERVGTTALSFFPQDTAYFGPGAASFMVNYRVDDLDALLAQLKAEGVEVDDRVDEYDFGRFGWIVDPEGRRIELWEPSSAHETGAEQPES